MNYIFDVDGTLTPSRGVIDAEFKQWFLNFAQQNPVYLATGSDYDKTVEQLGEEILHTVVYSFNCAGNAVYSKGKLVWNSDWTVPPDVREFLEQYVISSKYPHKFGKHLEERLGLLNFSVVGRNAKGQQRTDYYNWDLLHGERQWLVNELTAKWPDIQAAAGGETGIDIFARGCDKAQVLKYITGPVQFFGDRIDPDGNDWSIAQAIIDQNRGQCYNVRNWRDTYEILKLVPHSNN